MAQSSNRCYCSVPYCSNNKQKFPYLSFHDFPVDAEMRFRWVRAIKRDEGPSFKIRRGSTYVCSQHFAPEDIYTYTYSGRIRIKQGAVPSRFHWNDWGKGRGSKAWETLGIKRSKKHLSAAGLLDDSDSEEMPFPWDSTEEPADAMAKEHDYAGYPSLGQPAYEMMETDQDWAPSLHLGHTDFTLTDMLTDTACSPRRSKRGHLRKNTLQAAKTRVHQAGESGQLHMKRPARKGSKTVTSDNGDCSNGDAADTSAVKGILPNPKRKRPYKILLEEEAIVGETLEGSSQSENRKLDIEGRYPQGSWEQATVEAIMNLRTFDATTTTSQIAQTIIANLKDENDFLRAQNIKLQWELKSMQEKHSADLQATNEELLALKDRCTCTDEHSKTLQAVTTEPEAEVVEAIEIVHTGVLEIKSEPGQSYEVETVVIVDHAAPSEIMCTAANTKTEGNSESDV